LSRKLLQMLKMITKDLKEKEFYSEELVETFKYDDPDIFALGDELSEIESAGSLEEDELDVLKSLLVYILIRKSSLEKEDIYSLVFGLGRRILWN
jgi:hypothetical protein